MSIPEPKNMLQTLKNWALACLFTGVCILSWNAENEFL